MNFEGGSCFSREGAEPGIRLYLKPSLNLNICVKLVQRVRLAASSLSTVRTHYQ